MPYQSVHRSHSEGGSRARTRRDAEATEAPPHEETSHGSAEVAADALAGFALLAAPSAIAGGTPAPDESDTKTSSSGSGLEPESRGEEVERLRVALHLRSQEIEALRERWVTERPNSPSPEEPQPVVTQTAEPPSPGRLLDAAGARRLAADARAREQASREALEAAQKAIAAETPEIHAENPTNSAASTPSSEGWQQRPLVARDDAPLPNSDAIVGPPEEAQTSPSITKSTDESETLRQLKTELAVARAEKREAESRVTLATKKAARQQTELTELRERFSEKLSEKLAEREIRQDAAVAAPDREKIARQTERVSALEAEIELGRNERRLLERTIEDGRETLAARNARLDALEDRLEAQDRALDAARREYELERERHTRSLGLLDQLRATLSAATLGGEAAGPRRREHAHLAAPTPDAAPTPSQQEPSRNAARVTIPIAPPTDDATGLPPSDAETHAIVAGNAPVPSATKVVDASALPEQAEQKRPARSGSPNAPLFDRWLDDQVRRHFGPMGIDAFSDLLRAPLERNSSARDERRSILLLGHSAWQHVPHFVESLLEAGPTEFVVYVADPSGDAGDLESDLPIDSPLRDLIESAPFPTSPEALDELLASLKPTAVVSRDFLSREASPEAWTPIFEAATERNCALLFAERTGSTSAAERSELANSSEMSEIGERIWTRMPERYTRVPDGSTRFESFGAAFEHAPMGLGNRLFETIRAAFNLEVSAQFGFLVEPFLSSPIAAHFDADAARDQRFLQQVSDLDDRKIEAGVAPGLHFVGLVDPQAES